MRDLYEILQVHPLAEAEVIRAAYRTLARKYHPDHGGDAVRMTQINDAWDVLGDPVRRAAYDAARASGGSARASAPAHSAAERKHERPAAATQRPAAAPAQDRESTVKYDPGAPRPVDPGHVGPPPGRPSGSVLDFGRYAGWSLGEIARLDRDYLEWLSRSTIGRGLRSELDALLRGQGGAGAASAPPAASRNWPRR